MNSIDISKCIFKKLTQELVQEASPFDCGKSDLNEFFENDAFNFELQLFGKTYCFLSNSNEKEIISIFTISNDSVKVRTLPEESKRQLRRNIPEQKQRLRNYPAVLIGRLGVNRKYTNSGIGSQILDFLKSWFREENNKTGCRFLIVDAYNSEQVISFYGKNGFSFLFDNEKIEAKFLGISLKPSESLRTRIMFYDLIEIFV
ncbi:MAG: GNAT family N-acetyltransferase [Fibromonadales bacterium]|nr:GNAT family N-acetyltransferase [Fibromonadales bacterium]